MLLWIFIWFSGINIFKWKKEQHSSNESGSNDGDIGDEVETRLTEYSNSNNIMEQIQECSNSCSPDIDISGTSKIMKKYDGYHENDINRYVETMKPIKQLTNIGDNCWSSLILTP